MGDGKERAFLVLGPNYTIKGLATSENAAQKYFADENIICVGPIYFDDAIKWDQVHEERFGVDLGDVKDYIHLNDGVPMEDDRENWALVRYPHRRR